MRQSAAVPPLHLWSRFVALKYKTWIFKESAVKYDFRPILFCVCLALACGAATGAAASPDNQNWIQVAPGARPAYVGIQGGTATVSLSLSPDGSIIAHTGTSGNDFTKILHKDPPAAATAPDIHSTEPADAALSGNRMQAVNESDLLPVGLDSRPEAIAFAPVPRQEPKTAARPLKPLKLGSYRQVLRSQGSV